MNKRILVICILAILIALTLSGCMPGNERYTPDKPAGFLWGIWHGWIAPISLIGGLFNKSIRVYEAVNTGWWYDFGFYAAIISGFGGLSLTRKKNSKK
jgi:hypothetical protein